MKLLKTDTVEFDDVYGANVPPYAILSHTWSTGEILLNDLQNPDVRDQPWTALHSNPPKTLSGTKLQGFDKILGTIALSRRNQYKHVWVDTCCIDKTSSAELSEAINSMYRWYAGADVCYAYLADVPPASVESPLEENSKFRRSRWFTRGWTLQELIAPKQVELFASDWSYLGSKDGDVSFTKLLSEITGVQLEVLLGTVSPQDMSIASRMSWAAGRQSTREEDIAYCLLGIFEVTMPLLYGEGRQSFVRLQEAILSKEEDQSLFAWHSDSLSTGLLDDNLTSSGFSGLLADSPDRFADGNDIETAMPMTLKSNPSAVTSKGLRVEFSLLPCAFEEPIEGADFRVVLNCERLRQGHRDSPVIYLKRIWGMGQQFTRVRSDLRTFIPPNINFLEEGHDETIYVKQDPRLDMRTIRIEAAADTSTPLFPGGIGEHRTATDWKLGIGEHRVVTNWKIRDAWPKQGWVENKQIFQTRDMTFGMPCGILRLDIIEAGRSVTMDVAIGMNASKGQNCRSWCQILNYNSILTIESAFLWAEREATVSRLEYNSLSTRDIHGTKVATWIMVNERNRKGRLDIALHVLSEKLVDLEDISEREGYGHIIPVSGYVEEWDDFASQSAHPFRYSPDQTERLWEAWSSEVTLLMEDICVVDSIEMSVFPGGSLGTKVRIRSPKALGLALGSLKEYCIKAVPSSDKETRSLIDVLCGDGEADARSYLDAARVLKSRPDPFLQLSPLQWAVIGGKEEIVNVLVGTDDDHGAAGGRLTTVHLSFLLPEPKIMHHVCDMAYPTGFELNFYNQAKQGNYIPTIYNQDFPLHFAAAYATSEDYWTTDLYKMDQGPQVNRLGEKPLHRAAAMGNIWAIRWLLFVPDPSDADWETRRWNDPTKEVNGCDFQDRTPLWHAACFDHSGIITKELLLRGARPELTDRDGLAPIHVACRQGNIGCVKKLRAGGASLNVPAGALGLLPSHYAVIFGRKSCLDVLLRHRAAMKSSGNDHIHPRIDAFHLAIANGRQACALAIWNARKGMETLIFTGWSLCIVFEETRPGLKWMWIEITEELWFAIEDPRQDGGTRDFVCLSEEDSSPKLWARPEIAKRIEETEEDVLEELEEPEEEEEEEETQIDEKTDYATWNEAAAMAKESTSGSTEALTKKHGKARRIFKSMFKGQE